MIAISHHREFHEVADHIVRLHAADGRTVATYGCNLPHGCNLRSEGYLAAQRSHNGVRASVSCIGAAPPQTLQGVHGHRAHGHSVILGSRAVYVRCVTPQTLAAFCWRRESGLSL